MNRIIIDGDQARLYGTPKAIPQGQSQFSPVQFSFSEEWANLRKIAQFEQRGNIYNVEVSDDRCFCPSELVKGRVNVRVKGYPEDTTSAVIATANEIILPVSMGFQPGGTPSVPPTPDLYQELIGQIKDAMGKMPYIGNNGNWYLWDSEEGAFADSGFAATGPQGKPGENAKEYPPRINEETQTWLIWQDGEYQDTGLPIAIDGSLPPGGDPGDIVVRTADGAQWQPDQLTDEELLQAMIDTDTLPAVHDSGGILTDEDGKIILW